MHGKGEFFKIKEGICNIPIESGNICNILPRPAACNGLIVVLKRDLKYRGHVQFEPVRPHIIYQALTHLKLYNKFMKMYLLQRVSQVKICLIFLILLKFKDNLSGYLKTCFLRNKND